MNAYAFVQTLEQPYEAIRTLYNGSSEVRLYRNRITGNERVGKRIDLLGVEEALALNEAELLESIRHRNVVEVVDVFPVSGFPAPMRVVEIMMPYYPRRSLFDAFERGERFGLRDACQVVEAALLGLAHLHEVHGVLHRDVKSSNLIVAHDPSLLKVGDLGVAVRLDSAGEAPSFTQGMHPYIPPETHQRPTVTRSGDLYGIGLVLFELASGPLPYREYTTKMIASRIERGWRGPRPRDLNFRAHVPPHLRRIINKAIAVTPEDRFQTAAEMSNELARVRLIDWRQVEESETRVTWEGASVQRPDRRYRVVADRSRGRSGWRVSGLQRVTAWRRVVEDVIAPGPDDPSVARLFESLRSLATAR